MFSRYKKLYLLTFFLLSFLFSPVYGESIKKIEIIGNERVSDETILMFSEIATNDIFNLDDSNVVLKKLYNTNFFKDVTLTFENNILVIKVIENPIIQSIIYEGIKANKIKDPVTKNLLLKQRSSFNKVLLKKDQNSIKSSLKNFGYYFSEVDVFVEDLDDNKVNIKFKINLGKKAKIRKISFIGDKIFKDSKLKSIIISEEFKFWKFISGKKYLNENLINLDKRLLKNFYINKGFYNVSINSSFGKLINEDEFELVFNITPNKKIFFGDLSIDLPADFDKDNFETLENLFADLKDKPYSLSKVEKILDNIDTITINDQYENVSASVVENFNFDKINLTFVITETEKMFVQRINIFGNNVTQENVIRNQLEIDEGDPFNAILEKKSINNLKSLNFFKNVKSEILDGTIPNSKIVNIEVEEKPTGEIAAGAGVGTDGGTVSFGVKENNYLGRGIAVNSNLTINEESLKGLISITDQTYKNSNKSVYFRAEATETDRLKDFGYKTNQIGFSIGTNFEYYKDFDLGLGTSSYYERIETDSTASERQKKQKGNYWDTFLSLNFDYDKRNQNFQTTDGFRSFYDIQLPIISDTSTITSTYNYKVYEELYENNISTFSFLLKGAASLTGKDVKLSERLFVPAGRLRGFESGKIGPKDGDDFVGGNYITAINLSSTLPQILENSQNLDFLMFFDAASIWGVDYDSTLPEGSKIRSSIGIGIDWLSTLGPLSFSLAQPITKGNNDVTESFRFNLGTTF